MPDTVLLRSLTGVLTILTVLSLSSGDYVRRGSDITDCSLKCPRSDGSVSLYRKCGDDDDTFLLELWCQNKSLSNDFKPRLHLNPGSGCWTLTDARKDDSCVYKVVSHGKEDIPPKELHITVFDPVLISNITSNCSRLGQDIAVSVQFSGEETAVTWEVDGGPLPDRYRLMDDNRTLIIPSAQRDDGGRRLRVRITNPISEETQEYQLETTDHGSSRLHLCVIVVVIFLVLVVMISFVLLGKYLLCKKRKPEDVEKSTADDHSGEHGPLTNISPDSDPPGDGKQNLCIRIRRLWRNHEHEQCPQIDGEAVKMDEIPATNTKQPGL